MCDARNLVNPPKVSETIGFRREGATVTALDQHNF